MAESPYLGVRFPWLDFEFRAGPAPIATLHPQVPTRRRCPGSLKKLLGVIGAQQLVVDDDDFCSGMGSGIPGPRGPKCVYLVLTN
jgi:hypothetical protein